MGALLSLAPEPLAGSRWSERARIELALSAWEVKRLGLLTSQVGAGRLHRACGPRPSGQMLDVLADEVSGVLLPR